MLRNISWTDFIIAVVLVSSIYYLYVVLRYFSAELKGLVSGKQNVDFKAEPLDEETALPVEAGEEYDTDFGIPEDEDFRMVTDLVERLKRVIADAPAEKRIPEEFKQYLHQVLKDYPSIKNSPLRSSVNELIVSEWDKYSADELTEEEVDLLWEPEV